MNRDDPLTVPLLSADVQVVSWCMAEPEAGSFGLRQEDGVEYLSHGNDLLMPTADLNLAGRHNVANSLAALALGYCAGLPVDSMLSTLRTFRGLPHRCERVADIDGVRYVNDSKGTNVGATEAALGGLGGDRNVLLIAGGQGKGADFTPLQPVVAHHCKHLVLIGEDAAALERALAASAPLTRAASMGEAVALAAALAAPGDCVLLSPACASFDMFSGYVERGTAFCAAVELLREGRL